jgi:hypothetical protein
MWTDKQMQTVAHPFERPTWTVKNGVRRQSRTLWERLLDGVDCSDPDKCWLVTAQPAARYPKLWVGDGPVERHRVMFYLAYGWLPEVVMHACDTPRCLNPLDLRPGTHEENAADMYGKARGRFTRGVCVKGHSLEAGSPHLYVNPTTGRRMCRTCQTDRARERRERRREK